jgi:copper chaperone NosL
LKLRVLSRNRNWLRRTVLFVAITALLMVWPPLWAAEKKPVKPTPKDKCPVCGMFVYKYSDFLAQIVFKDGTVAFFDGSKDMFKYYINIQKYRPKGSIAEIDSIYVTDYYSLSPIDGTTAVYVIGSDVYGPMGKELVPFMKDSEAGEFMKDHKGRSLLRFQEITGSILKGLD